MSMEAFMPMLFYGIGWKTHRWIKHDDIILRCEHVTEPFRYDAQQLSLCNNARDA